MDAEPGQSARAGGRFRLWRISALKVGSGRAQLQVSETIRGLSFLDAEHEFSVEHARLPFNLSHGIQVNGGTLGGIKDPITLHPQPQAEIHGGRHNHRPNNGSAAIVHRGQMVWKVKELPNVGSLSEQSLPRLADDGERLASFGML